MGSKAVRTVLVALAASCLIAVPISANAGPSENPHGKPSAAPTDEPQPKSNADMNKGGANNGGDCGAYCSTRDGSPSENGKGDGEAKGKPCAGCVGKADNKNPPGQQPDGSDHNAGYECDRNQGVGKTNPAHTGCKTTETTPSPSVSPTSTPSPCVPTNDNPCESESPTPTPSVSSTVSESPCVDTPTHPCESGTPSPSVSGTVSESPSASTTPSVKGVVLTRRPNAPEVIGGRLPTTGSNASVALLLLVGLGLVATGVSITVATPARHH